MYILYQEKNYILPQKNVFINLLGKLINVYPKIKREIKNFLPFIIYLFIFIN